MSVYDFLFGSPQQAQQVPQAQGGNTSNFLANLGQALQPIAQYQTGRQQQKQFDQTLQPIAQYQTGRQQQKQFDQTFALNPEFAAQKFDTMANLQKAQAGPELPSNVREYNYYQSLDPAAQAEYLRVKRSSQIFDYGGGGVVLDPRTGTFTGADIPKTLPPQNQPQNVFNQNQASAEGTAAGERAATLEKKGVDAQSIINLANEAEKLLPEATAGVADKGDKAVRQFFGVGSTRQDADARLKIVAAALTGNVPRFEGPQGVLDVELYKQAAGDVANSDLPYTVRLAGLTTIKDLQKRYLPQGQGMDIGAGLTPEQFDAQYAPQGGNMANPPSLPGSIPMPAKNGVQVIQTQQEYDSLPSGSVYVDPEDGKQYRKP